MRVEEWVMDYCRRHGKNWADMTQAEQVRVEIKVPCSIMCFRVGVPVEVKEGERCPECGKLQGPVRSDWARKFLDLAATVATWSKDPSTKVGCVIVGPDREVRSLGYNGFPRGVADTEERLRDRELKYPLTVHAEMNALLNAARVGTPTKGCTAYVTFPPCVRCAGGLIQAGVTSVTWPRTEIPERWQKDFELAQQLLKEAEIAVEEVGA